MLGAAFAEKMELGVADRVVFRIVFSGMYEARPASSIDDSDVTDSSSSEEASESSEELVDPSDGAYCLFSGDEARFCRTGLRSG